MDDEKPRSAKTDMQVLTNGEHDQPSISSDVEEKLYSKMGSRHSSMSSSHERHEIARDSDTMSEHSTKSSVLSDRIHVNEGMNVKNQTNKSNRSISNEQEKQMDSTMQVVEEKNTSAKMMSKSLPGVAKREMVESSLKQMDDCDNYNRLETSL